MKKRAVSNVVGVMIILVILVAITGIVFAVVYTLVNKSTKESGACFDALDAVSIEGVNTCYGEDQNTKMLKLPISVKDIELSGILVSVYGESRSNSFTLLKEGTEREYVTTVDDDFWNKDLPIYPPGRNSGITYAVFLDENNLNVGRPNKVEIAPIINGQQCGVSDKLIEIIDCP